MYNACQQERAYHIQGSWKTTKQAMWLEEREAASPSMKGKAGGTSQDQAGLGMELGISSHYSEKP